MHRPHGCNELTISGTSTWLQLTPKLSLLNNVMSCGFMTLNCMIEVGLRRYTPRLTYELYTCTVSSELLGF